VEYFDAMHAAVALGRNAILVTNDEIYKTLGVKTISFDELIKKIKGAGKSF
jgi:predicted nucleic acid-binding protein